MICNHGLRLGDLTFYLVPYQGGTDGCQQKCLRGRGLKRFFCQQLQIRKTAKERLSSRTHHYNLKKFSRSALKSIKKTCVLNHIFKKDDRFLTLLIAVSIHTQNTHRTSRYSQAQGRHLTRNVEKKKDILLEQWKEKFLLACLIIRNLDVKDCEAEMDGDTKFNSSLPSFANSSPVLASLANISKGQVIGNNTSSDTERQQVLMTSFTKAMKRRSPCKQDEFWEALQSNYNYLMDEGLIKSCKEANGELAPDNDVATTVWTFSEYMEHYKMLCEWLEKLRNKVWSVEDTSAPEKTSKEMHAEELRKLNILRKLFIEQSQGLCHRYPNLNDEITLQVAHVNTCWDELEKAIIMDKPKLDAKLLLKDISYEIRCLRKWLQEIQMKLKLPILYPGCTIEDLEEKYKQYQALQKDIESHQKNVLSVLKLCDQLQQDDQASTLVRDAAHVQTVAHNLQRRWHATWLKSLECHFVIEELIAKFREGVFPGKLLESSIDDEPLKKYPRLSGEWSGNPLLTSQKQEKNGACFSPNCTSLDDDTDCDGLISDEIEDEFYSAIEGPLNMSLDVKTRDIGTGNDGFEMTTTNDKGVMVGTTGITELKAGHEGSFEPFEIIQDIGYSSESSTQLSSNEERNGESIQIYSYDKRNSIDDIEMKPEMKEETDSVQEQMDGVDEGNGIVTRPGPNCATYYFRHVDTDPECKFDDQEELNSYLTHSTPLKRNSRDLRHSVGQERSLTRWSDVGSIDSSFELDSTVSRIDWSEDDFREKQQIITDKFPEDHKECQNSIHALVEAADRLVRNESLTEMLGPRHNLEPLKLGEAQTKANRLKEWLRKQNPICPIAPALPPTTVLDSSCDASGECTSNDSEDEHSETSEDLNNSVILCHKRKGSLDGTMELNEGSGKVIMRNKKRSNGSRPWSVTELYQLTNRLDLSPFSISESALNVLLTPTALESNCFDNSSPSIVTEKDVCSPSSESINLISARKTKSAKVRRRHIRRSDSGSDNHSLTQSSANGSDGCNQKTLIHHVRRHSRGSKSHSSSSGGGKSAGQSSGTEQYSSEANKGVTQADVSDSESEPTMVEKIHKLGREQTEELSSLSEQAWDDYQEAPYLSETYSENQIDEDLIKRLVNFGDDYSAFIESQSDSISVGSYKGLRNLRISGRFSRKQALNSSDNMEEDSDSDVDDLNHIIDDSCNQLQWLETRVRKHVVKDVRGRRHNSLSLTSEYIELFATCQTNINCLQVIAGHLQAKPYCTSVSEADVQKVKDTILRWEKLRCLMQEQQSEHKMGDVQQQMTDFEESMKNIDNSITGCDNKIDDKTILERMIQEFQAYLSMLQEKKATLLTINVQVHSFMASPASSDPTLSKLKEEVAALYHRWDEIFEKGNIRLSSLNTLKNTWLEYENELEELQSELSKDKETSSLIPTTDHVAPQPHLLFPATCSDASNEVEVSTLIKDSLVSTLQVPVSAGLNGVSPPLPSGINPEKLAKRQAQLTQLQDFAHRMEDMLANTKAWDSISQQLNSTAAELQQLQPRGGRRKSSFLLPNSPRSDVPKRVRFSIAPDMDKPDGASNKGGNKRHSFLWRVIRAAVPIQLAIIVVLCVAYLLGPDCCDSRNNFVFSFSPHLRYVNGPPPV